jgi:hypothetical protein
MNEININNAKFHGEWNYSIKKAKRMIK